MSHNELKKLRTLGGRHVAFGKQNEAVVERRLNEAYTSNKVRTSIK